MPDPLVTGSLPPVLNDARLAPLWQAAHRRLEANGGRLAGSAVHLRQPSNDQRAAIDRLLGVRSRGSDLRVPLDRLDDLLRQRLDTSLCEVVTATVGSVRDRPGERSALSEAEAAMWDRLLTHRVMISRPTLVGWLLRMQSTGAWRRLEDPETRLTEALEVLAQLPQSARCGRSRLAARTLGRAHALNDDQPTGRLVTAALSHLAGMTGRLRAAERRKLWADEGVIADDTSSSVLTLGLRPRAVGPLTEAARRWADGATPLSIPLAAVQTEFWEVPSETLIWVCENPSVLAAGAGSDVTMISLEGWPSLAARLLLGGLAECGAEIVYHGDFGHGGVSIANWIIGEFGAEPWRFGVEDYRFALDRSSTKGTELQPLRGTVPDASWDPYLAPAIRAGGVEVEEEFVIDLLLDDVRKGAPPRPEGHPSPGKPAGDARSPSSASEPWPPAPS